MYNYKDIILWFRLTREVNPYKKCATFASFFCVHVTIKVSITFFLFPTNILSNKVKQVCYKIIFIYILFVIYYDFLKIFNIVRKKKCGHHEKSCEFKQLLFLRVYLSGLEFNFPRPNPVQNELYTGPGSGSKWTGYAALDRINLSCAKKL